MSNRKDRTQRTWRPQSLQSATGRHRPLILLVFMIILAVLPVRILLDHYSPDGGFLGLIYFGRDFKGSVLSEVREISPVTDSRWGYDGQFYAQVALNPTLTDKALARALDNATHRSRRIGLPFLAFCLGLGRAPWILQVYALLNVGFWLLLLVAIIRCVGHRRSRDLLLAIALLWSTGTLTSVARSLPDFPAAVLGVLAVFSSSNWIVSTILLAASGLIKETSVLSLAAVPWCKKPQGCIVKRLVISVLIIMLPISIWSVYVHVRLPFGSGIGHENFAFPLSGIALKLYNSFYSIVTEWAGASVSRKASLLFETLCPLSLITQALYLTAKPRLSSVAWRFGIGFVMLLVILGQSVWAEQYAYCRVLLPLTFSFNLVIHEYESGGRLAIWYLLGNGGMCWLALQQLL